MNKLKKISRLTLVFSNTAITLGLTILFHTWVPAVTDAGPERFMLVFIVTAAVISLVTVVGITYAKTVDPSYNWAFSGAYEEAIDLRERALNEHTIVSVAAADGRVKEINRNFVETFGYDEEEIVGELPAMLYDDAVDGTPFIDVWNVVSKGGSWQGEQRLKAKDGRTVHVQTTIIPRFNRSGDHTDSISIRTDLSRARAEGMTEGRNSVIEGLPDGVIVYDAATFNIVYVNKNGRARLGWNGDDVTGRNMSETFKHFDHGLFRRYLDPLLSGEANQVVIQVQHDTGPIEIVTNFDVGADGTRHLISVVRDITERKQAERMKLSSVSMVSHELRTPLTSIKGALRLMESGALGELRPEVSRMISVAHRNSDRLLAIVNDILVLEKIDSGEMSFAKEVVDLRDIVQEAVEANAGYGEECGIQFGFDPQAEAALVDADPARLMQVMSNLMSNAAKFSPVGAEVTLRIEDRRDSWRVCVQDRGPGIPESAHKTLFDSFFQVEGTEQKSRPGTGLGLTISKKIIQRHGGMISFETELGKGTVFYFDLAKQDPNAEEAPRSAVA